jgi:DNA-binding IclR family transcriptional regulator
MSGAGDLRARQPKAIHSALAVLEEVARCGAGVTAQEVSAGLDMPRATTYRLLNLLVQDEYLVRMPDLRGFALGRKVVELAHLVAPAPPPQAARDVMGRMRSSVRGGVHLVRYEGERIRIVDPDPDFPLSDEARIVRHLDASAIGRLLLRELVSGGQDCSGLVASPSVDVGALVDDVERLGYARQSGELTPGYGCLVVPIRDDRGGLVAGLSLSAPSIRVEQPADLLDLMLDGSRQLAPLLV